MNGNTLRQSVRVTNPNGFHMRPMKEFVELARRFQSASARPRAADGDRPQSGGSIELCPRAHDPKG